MDRTPLPPDLHNAQERPVNSHNLPYVERIPDPDHPGNQLAEICIEIRERQVYVHTGIEEEHTAMTLSQLRRFYDGVIRAWEAGRHYQDDLDAAEAKVANEAQALAGTGVIADAAASRLVQ